MELGSQSQEVEGDPFFKVLNDGGLRSVLSQGQSSTRNSIPHNRLFDDGQTLPTARLKSFKPQTMACTPMEEIDPTFDGHKTFVVFGKKGTVHRFSATDSLFLFSPLSPLRLFCIRILTNWWFSAFMVAIILLNTILMASDLNYGLNYVCLVIYIFELLFKVISHGGFMDPFTCFRNAWTWLDILVIVTSITTPLGIRLTIEWARILKIIPLISEMRKAFSFMMEVIQRLGSAICLASFWIAFFAIIGLQHYLGVLTQKCIKHMPPSDPSLLYDLHKLWLENANNKSNWLTEAGNENEYYICGNASGSGVCPEGYTCLQGFGPNPFYGYMNFDSYGWALMTTTQVVDQDFGESVVNMITRAVGPWDIVYFTAVFLFGTFGICTLVYAILSEHFFQTMKELDASKSSNGNTEGTGITPTPGAEQIQLIGFRGRLQSILNQFSFEVFITIVIVFDILLWSVDYIIISSFSRPYVVLEISYLFIFVAYLAEFLMKIAVIGPKSYVSNGWNIFDFIILLQILMSIFFSENPVSNPFQIFKIIPRWSTLKLTFAVIYESFKYLWGFFGLFFTFWIFFALTGKNEFDQAYANGKDAFPGGEVPRWNFVDYPHSFLMVFRAWAGEAIESVWDCLLVKGVECFIYFPVVALTGALTLMTLTVGVAYVTVKTLEAKESQIQNASTLSRIGDTCCFPFTWMISKIKGTSIGAEISTKPRESLTNENAVVFKDDTENLISSVQHQPRRTWHDCADGQIFNTISIVVIVIMSLFLLFSTKEMKTEAFVMDLIFIVFFSLLSCYKLIAVGVSECLWSWGWIFDVFLVSETIIHLVLNLQPNSYESYSYILFFFVRSLRPFMLVSRIERLEVVLRGIVNELKFLYNFIFSGLFIWLYFALFGITLFGHRFYKCVDLEGSKISTDVVQHQSQCHMGNFSWENSLFNFDNLANGFLSLSFVGSRLGWIEIMHNAFDVVGHGMNFETENGLERFIFFFAFIVVGVFFLFSMIFGILYHNLRKEEFSGIFLTQLQFSHYKAGDVSDHFTIPKPETPNRARIYDLVNSTQFDAIVIAVIVLDNMSLAFDYYNMPAFSYDVILTIRLTILILYTVELILKLVGWGKFYFRSSWNRYDFWVVLSSYIDAIATEFASKYIINLTIFRPFRIFRIFQFKLFRSPQMIIGGYLKALERKFPALWNIFMLECLLIMSYCIFGISIFGNIKPGNGFYATNHFRNIMPSIHAMFTITSFSGFDTILRSLINEVDCYDGEQELGTSGDCGNKFAGIFFMFSFLLGTFLLMLNLYFVFVLEIVNQIKKDKISTGTALSSQHGNQENGLEIGMATDRDGRQVDGEPLQDIDIHRSS